MDNKPFTEPIPANYFRCPSAHCSAADHCLRSYAWHHADAELHFVNAVNPCAITHDAACPLFRSMVPQRYARGFMGMQARMLPGQYAQFMREGIDHFGQTRFYLCRRGERPMSPRDQAFLRQLAKDVGATGAGDFDGYEDRINWE